jgi:hypothetical protein
MARLTTSFASNRIEPLAVTVVEPITTQGAVRAAAKAARQAGDAGPARTARGSMGGPMGGSRPGPRLCRDGVLVGAAADSVADR